MSIFDASIPAINKQQSLTLVAGTATINDSNVKATSVATAQLKVAGGTLGVNYTAVCTAGVVTVTSVIAAGTINVLDTSTLTVNISY